MFTVSRVGLLIYASINLAFLSYFQYLFQIFFPDLSLSCFFNPLFFLKHFLVVLRPFRYDRSLYHFFGLLTVHMLPINQVSQINSVIFHTNKFLIVFPNFISIFHTSFSVIEYSFSPGQIFRLYLRNFYRMS